MTQAKSTKSNSKAVLKVTVTGGGPVGLGFALLLEQYMGKNVSIKVYDSRWTTDGSRVVWRNEAQGNARRQQVVTLQSRQYLKLPKEVQERIFSKGVYTEMWPIGPDSINGFAPRNVRIAHIEDTLLEIANDKKGIIQLIPSPFDPIENHDDIIGQHVLVICEGGRSRTREHFLDKFGTGDKSLYSLGGNHLQDVVLGLRVKSELSDPMAVLLTVAQNRFLLNSLRGEGFLNMRLTDEEVKEVRGVDIIRQVFEECIQSRPCLMEHIDPDRPGEFKCSTHGTLFLPALLRSSALWRRVQEGLVLFGVKEENLSAVTAFRLDLVQRSRFTAQLFPPTQTTPGTYGFLLGDAANAIHFWPGRGLNSGFASAVSLARCLKNNWRGNQFRDADFLRHESLMSMLQYRHKTRAWRAMVTTDSQGTTQAIKEKIALGITEGEAKQNDKDADIAALMDRLVQIRSRLEKRINGLPDDDTLRKHLRTLKSETLRTLVVSEAWDTVNVSGEEVEVDLFFEEPEIISSSQSSSFIDETSSATPNPMFDWVEVIQEKLLFAKVPVTNKQYKSFIDAKGYNAPEHWNNNNFPDGKDDHPIVNISWQDAKAFCEWAQVELPTDDEWEKAARGPNNNRFPFKINQTPTGDICNFNNLVGDTTSVYSYPNGVNGFGLLDMAGNAWEWTADSGDFATTTSDGNGIVKRSLRGGCYLSDRNDLRCSYKLRISKNEKRETIGFRVVFRIP